MTREEASAALNAAAVEAGPRALEAWRAMAEPLRMQALSPVLRPYVLLRSQVHLISFTSLALKRAMDQVLLAWARDAALGESVKVPDAVAAQAREDALAGRAFGYTRFDFTLTPEGDAGRLGLLEVQAGDPSGMGIQHALAAHFAQAAASVGGGCESTASSLRRFIAPEPAGAGLVVFAIHRSALLQFDHALVCDVFRSEGVDAVTADPDELSFDGRALTWQGRPVSRVVRDSLEDLLEPERARASRALLEAWRAGAVQVFNPAGSVVADHKVLLAHLSEEPTLAPLHPLERKALGGAVLPVRRLTPALSDEVLSSRASLVLKPSDGYGGFGVVVGPAVDEAAWRASVDDALRAPRPFVVQEYRAPPWELFPVPRDGGVALERRNVVLSAWLHGDRFGGVFARVHGDAVVNVHQGGGLLPVCILNG